MNQVPVCDIFKAVGGSRVGLFDPGFVTDVFAAS